MSTCCCCCRAGNGSSDTRARALRDECYAFLLALIPPEERQAHLASRWYSHYFRYWYKSTNTDANALFFLCESREQRHERPHSSRAECDDSRRQQRLRHAPLLHPNGPQGLNVRPTASLRAYVPLFPSIGTDACTRVVYPTDFFFLPRGPQPEVSSFRFSVYLRFTGTKVQILTQKTLALHTA